MQSPTCLSDNKCINSFITNSINEYEFYIIDLIENLLSVSTNLIKSNNSKVINKSFNKDKIVTLIDKSNELYLKLNDSNITINFINNEICNSNFIEYFSNYLLDLGCNLLVCKVMALIFISYTDFNQTISINYSRIKNISLVNCKYEKYLIKLLYLINKLLVEKIFYTNTSIINEATARKTNITYFNKCASCEYYKIVKNRYSEYLKNKLNDVNVNNMIAYNVNIDAVLYNVIITIFIKLFLINKIYVIYLSFLLYKDIINYKYLNIEIVNSLSLLDCNLILLIYYYKLNDIENCKFYSSKININEYNTFIDTDNDITISNYIKKLDLIICKYTTNSDIEYNN